MNKISNKLSLLFILFYWIDVRIEFVLLFLLIVSILWSKAKLHQPVIFSYHDLLFVLYAFFVVLTNFNQAEFLRVLRDLVLLIWAIRWCFQNIEYTERYQNQLISTIGIVCFFLAFYMFFQDEPGHFNFSLSYIISKDRNAGFNFIYPEPVGPTTIASILAVGYTYLLLKLVNKTNIFRIGFFIFTFLLITISGGRSSWIAIFFISITILYLKTDLLKPRNWIILGSILGIIILLFIFIIPDIPIFYSPEFQQRLFAFSDPSDNQTVTVRFIYWGIALAMFYAHPGGIGFWAYFDIYGRTAHNEILGQVLGVGIGGLIIYLGFYIYSFIELRKMKKFQTTTDNFQVFAYSFFIVIFFTGITENFSISSRFILYPLVWVMLGTISSKLRHLKNKK